MGFSKMIGKRSMKRRIETSDNILYNTGLPEVYFIL